jgi:tetratricopeptide (TPR) repeat protein
MIRDGRKPRALLIVLSLLLTACASTGADQGAPSGATDPSAPEPEAPERSEQPLEPPLDGRPDPGDEVALKVWTAEVFGSEGQLEKAAREYLAAALLSDDPEIARRATEVAISAQAWPLAAMAADRWVLLQPDDLEARETAVRALLVGDDYVRAELQLVEYLGQLAETSWGGWPRIAPLLLPARDPGRALELVDRLIEDTGSRENPYARYTRSRLLVRAGDFEGARELAEEAVTLAPLEAPLRAWAGRLALGQRDDEAALGHFRAAWQMDPTERPQALAYAELLRQTGRPDEANEVLASLPDTPENRFTRIGFATESGNRSLAVDLYDGFRSMPYGDAREKAFQAGRSAEVLDRKAEAIDWYAQIDGGDNALTALLRRAFLLSQLGRLDEARTLLVEARNGGGAAVQLETLLLEAQILAEVERPEAAMAVLGAGLEQFPDNTRLLYTRSLIAVQLDQIELAESDLRTVLANEPGNAAALNALGYTLADRTDRLEEAEQLIRQAFQLEPDDPAIIDSMGWVAYRLGRLDEAERYLRQALMRQRNAEIAAHLGEVLHAQGRVQEAKRVWNEAMRIDPSDATLIETLQRFGVEL